MFTVHHWAVNHGDGAYEGRTTAQAGLCVPSDPGVPYSAATKYVKISTCAEHIFSGLCGQRGYNHAPPVSH